ncbi:hypothetical protein C804_06027 [Lachnospiraceae bacterium A4]|nr:hypothetical protein C804_06027 [Lachnospiraceae bacterium A4]
MKNIDFYVFCVIMFTLSNCFLFYKVVMNILQFF